MSTISFSSRPVRCLCWTLWFIGILCLIGWFAWEMGFRFNATASLPVGIYQLSPTEPQRGELACVCLHGSFVALAAERGYLTQGPCPSGLQPLLKKVVGLPGDSIRQDPAGIWINGVLWQRSRTRDVDSLGRSMPHVVLPERVPDSLILLLSDEHEGSFDGRYFGLVPLECLSRVEPIFTF